VRAFGWRDDAASRRHNVLQDKNAIDYLDNVGAVWEQEMTGTLSTEPRGSRRRTEKPGSSRDAGKAGVRVVTPREARRESHVLTSIVVSSWR